MNQTACGQPEFLRRGRPPLGEDALRSSVSVSLPVRVHEQLITIANRRGVSLSKLLRDLILARVRP